MEKIIIGYRIMDNMNLIEPLINDKLWEIIVPIVPKHSTGADGIAFAMKLTEASRRDLSQLPH